MAQSEKIQFQRLFESAPGLYLVLSPDLLIVAVSNAYLSATMTHRETILGRYLFDVFPDNPDDPTATGVNNLRHSLKTVLLTGKAHKMDLQKYDIRNESGGFEERYWSPVNTPVFDDLSAVEYIIHQVEDVTEMFRLQKEEIKQRDALKESNRQLLLEIEEREKTEEQIEAIFNAAPDAIIVIDHAGHVVNWNPKAKELFGWGLEEVKGNPLSESIIPHRYRERHEKGMAHFLKTGEGPVLNKALEMRALRKDETEFDVALSISPTVFNNEYLFIGFVRDITEQKKAEEKFKGLLESAPDAMIIADREGKIVLVNQQAVSLFGYTEKEITGQYVEILIPAMDRDKHVGHRARYYQEPKVRSMGAGLELYAIRKDESRFPVEISLSPLPTSEGMLVAAAIRDISERKKAEEDLRQLNKELESFTYSVSHDLRSPLRIIDGYADMLRSDYADQFDEDGTRYVEVIKSNARRMGQLIDDLLNLSHTGRKELLMHQTQMNRLVQLIIDEQFALHGQRTEVIQDKLEPAFCDSSLIKQVWSNLIGNAFKYSSKKEQPVVKIRSERNGSEIIYSVNDNGVGFDMQYAGKLFGVFQRLHKITEFDGTGVGLALVKRIIHKHKGRIWAESEPGKGATFFFSLPV